MAYDRYRTSVKSLLHFEGADNSTAITDERGKIWTALGGAKIKTAQHKFGSTAIYTGSSQSGNAAVNSSPSDPDIATPGDFTAEAFAFVVGNTEYNFGAIISKADTASRNTAAVSSYEVGVEYASGVYKPRILSFNTSGGSYATVGTIAIALNTWFHLALVREGDTVMLWVDGELSITRSVAGTMPTSSSRLTIGATNQSSNLRHSLNGYIDEFRLTPGVARYTEPFTPPTEAFDLTGYRVHGTVKKGDPAVPVQRKIVLVRALDQVTVGTGDSDPATGGYDIETDADLGETLIGMVYPDYGEPPKRSTAYSLDDPCWVGAPAPYGHWYQAEAAGTTGGTEPTWPTDGSTVVDGTVTWRDKGLMERPWAEGPYLAEAV